MRSATTATGRSLPPPGKTLAKNRPAPLTDRPTHRTPASKLQHNHKLQCYIPAPAPTRHSSLITGHRHVNRQPARRATNQESQLTNHVRSNRHTSRLQSAKNPTKTRFSAPLIVTKSRYFGAEPAQEISRGGMPCPCDCCATGSFPADYLFGGLVGPAARIWVAWTFAASLAIFCQASLGRFRKAAAICGS